MKRAAQLLTKGQLTVSEILFEVGIKSRSIYEKLQGAVLENHPLTLLQKTEFQYATT